MSFLMPPHSLTAGMPDPATIAKQKDAYMKMLDEQVKQGAAVLEAQVKHQKEYLLGQADIRRVFILSTHSLFVTGRRETVL